MIIIFFVAKKSHTGKVECIVLVKNAVLGFTAQVIVATFAADAEGCQCSNVGLRFVCVEWLYNA
jgi:hypothetical protein